MADPTASSAEAYVVPGWFAKFVGFVLLLAVPWAGWMTILCSGLNIRVEQLANQNSQIAALLDRTTRLEEKLISLEARVPHKAP